jgi:Uma2 family endonuclease
MVSDLQSHPFPFDTAHRFTIEEYYRLVEEGRLEEDARVELLDGQIIPMSPVGPRHQRIVSKLFRAFIGQEHGRFETEQGPPLPIPDHDEPQPDILLYRPGAANEQHHVQPVDVFLVVEVSKSTIDYDLGSKAKIYEGAKIPEYWVVNLEHNRLHVFTLEGDRYHEKTLEQGSVSPNAFPDVRIDLAALFGIG